VTAESAQPDSVESPLDLRVVCVIVGALALFAPFFVSIETTRGQVTFGTMMWAYASPGPGGGFHVFDPMEWIIWFPLVVWRVVFVYQMIRYYRGRSTRNRTVLAGILSETPPVAFYFWGTYIMSMGMGSYLTFPTPLMLIGALVFLWLTPYPVPKAPFDDQGEPDKWWEQNTGYEGDVSNDKETENQRTR